MANRKNISKTKLQMLQDRLTGTAKMKKPIDNLIRNIQAQKLLSEWQNQLLNDQETIVKLLKK